MRGRWTVAGLCSMGMVACSFSAAAQAKPSDDRVLVYVDNILASDPSLAADATGLTMSLCTELGKDKRIDVLCAPDVAQVLSFAATASMIGASGGAGGAIQDRLQRTRHVVSGALRKDGANVVLVVKGGPKAPDADLTALYSDKPLVAVEQKAEHQRKLPAQLPAVAARVVAALLKPAAAAAPPPPPPAPLASPAPASGW